MAGEEKSSLFRILNTSIGNISGLFSTKKESQGPSSPEEMLDEEKNAEESGHSLLLEGEEDEFEKELSQITVASEPFAQKDMNETPEEESDPKPKEKEPEEELVRLRKILSLKEELRAREKAKEKEVLELKVLEMVKIQTHLEYEKKQRRLMEEEIRHLKQRLEQSDLDCMELVKYCKLLVEEQQSGQWM